MTSMIAAIQMSSSQNIAENLATAERLVRQAADAGATLVVLPEYFYLMGKTDAERVSVGEVWGNGPIQDCLQSIAQECECWLLGGTVPLLGPDPDHVYNSSLMFNPQGDCVSRYDKIHLFGFQSGQESYCEADVLAAGQLVQTVSTPAGQVRCSVCYDLRFPELYRHAPVPDIIAVPAAFTYTTGAAHWEVLLRARAIENQCYVIAAAQTGVHPSGNRTFGHSMIIDPWGTVISQRPDGEGVVMAEMDPAFMMDIRRKLPALQNRVL